MLAVYHLKPSSLCWILTILFLLPALARAKDRKYRFDRIQVQSDSLVMDFCLNDFFDKDLFQGLRKGMTAAVEYQVQLWKKRSHWVDPLVSERTMRMKVNFDSWEKRYVLLTREKEPQLLHEDGVREKCSHLMNFSIVPVQKLEPGIPYTITVKAVLRPMSVENYREIKRWLAGDSENPNPKTAAQGSNSPLKNAGDWFLGMVVNLTGFGDRFITVSSPSFLWKEGAILVESGN